MPGFFRLQLGLLAVSLIIPTVCWTLVLAGAGDPLTLSNIGLPSVLGCWILALAVPLLAGGAATPALRLTSFVLVWAAIAITFPLIWDLPWAILHDWVDGATADDHGKWFFWAYAVADTRFLHSNPIMIIVEYWSGVIAVIEIAFVVTLLRAPLREAMRIFVLASSLAFYGCTVFFGSELANDLADIRPDAVSYLKFFGMNGMWMTVPALSYLMMRRLLQIPGYDARATCLRLFGRKSAELALSRAG